MLWLRLATRRLVTSRSSSARPISRAFRATTPSWATAVSTSSLSDPAEAEALLYLEKGTAKLEEGDIFAAKELYQRSCEIRTTPSSLFNLGVTHYHLKDYESAISSWKQSLELQPSADAHTNLASAYIMSPAARPDLALHHLHTAVSLSPDDAEIAFNLAAVLEATGNLEGALEQYQRSQKQGVERAAVHIRNVSAKILLRDTGKPSQS
uniref:TPR-like protein n=1 Tax=Mycena chlorophos TaxID=658473 RepID=A0ABQ0KVL4_MYCCL|nr:TPR-like protein [Mycena chlorophos]